MRTMWRRGLPLAAAAMLVTLPAAAQFSSGSICATAPSDPACLGDVTYSVNTVIPLPPDGVLQYGTLTVNSGVTVTFTPNALNTPVFILASGNVTITGSINVSAPAPETPGGATSTGVTLDGNPGDDGIPGRGGPGGFPGGPGGLGANYGGVNGQSGAVGGGPGGGGPGTGATSLFRAGGGGYGSAGQGINTAYGGPTYGQATIQPLVGGSGGGGAGGGSNFTGAGGGGGGGAILIASSGTLTVGGSIVADGAKGGRSYRNDSAPGVGHGGSGGGGSGGAIRVVAQAIAGGGSLFARGGAGGQLDACCDAGVGGAGRIRMESNTFTFSGSTNPTRTFDVPGPVFVPNNPTLRIAAIGGVAAPVAPTGSGDVTLPQGVSQPVTVALEASEVPLGTTVTIQVKPASGTLTSATSTALDGTLAASTATATVTLPQGASTVEAYATFTLVLSGGALAALTHDGETIERAEITVSSEGGRQVTYVTESGKRLAESAVGPLEYAMLRTGATFGR